MTQVLFDRLKSNLAQCINDGTIYFVKDSNGNFTQIALGDGSKSHVVGIGPKMDDATKQELMSKLGLTTSANMDTIQLGKLSNNNDVSSQKVVTYERTGLGTDTHEISTVGYVQQYLQTAQAMVYAGLFNAQTKEITDYNTAIISPSQEGNVTFDYLLNGNEGETLLTPGMSFIVGTAGDLEGYTGVSVYGGETKVEVGDMIIIINVEQKESVEGGSTYNEASILVIQNTNLDITDFKSGIIYDVSAHNDRAVFESLSALLSDGNLSTLIPTSVQHGGMTIRFIQGSKQSHDNKYVQYRLIADEFTTDTTQWAVADEGAYIDNPEFIYIKTDVEGKILWAISADGNIYYGAGVPQQVIDYIEKKIAGFSPDKYEDIVAFLNGLEQGDKTLQTLLNEKVDKEEGKSLISAGYASSQSVIDNSEYLQVTTDNNDKILEGVTIKGVKQINTPIDTPSATVEHAENPEWTSVTINSENKILEGISSDGVKHINLPINTPKVETKELVLSENGIEKLKEDLDIQHSNEDVISVNLDKECSLYAMAYDYPFFYYPGHENSGYGARYKKRLVFGWISDIHGGAEEYERFIKYNNNYKDIIDFMLVTGDISSLAPRDGGWHDTQDAFAPIAEMPILICLGNHDVTGNAGNEVIFDSLKEMDDELFMPWANQIEWTNKGSGSYYYKDFVNNDSGYKYRVIILNDYERPRLVSDGSWKTIDYDNALPTYSPDYSYSIGDKINLVNHSYEAVKSVSGIAPSRTYFDYIDGRYISETQALWLCDALSSMPDGYKAIICSHMMIGYTTQIQCNFTYSGGNIYGFQMSQNGYVIQDIINAFISKTSINKTYEMTKRMDSGRIDGEIINGFGYTLNYDFSNISENIDIKCCLTGHTHIDMVTKLTNITEKDIYNIMITQGIAQFQSGDLGNFGKKGKDAFNIVSVDKNIGLKMIRIGSDVTQDFVKRDNIIINI